MRYASESSMTSPCSAQYPAVESSVSGSVCSLKGNWTLSFCVSLNRSNGTGSPACTETPSFSRRYREPASAAVISLAFLRIRSSSCPTSRVSDRAIPTRFSSSRSRVALVTLSALFRALGTRLGVDFLIPTIERALSRSRRGRADRKYNESWYGGHAQYAPTRPSPINQRGCVASPPACGERASNQLGSKAC